VVTGAGNLPAGIVIHTVGPIWADGTGHHTGAANDRTLASCYRRSLDLAAEHNARTVAFPNISTGVYRFPKSRAATVAVNATLDWLESTDDHPIDGIHFVCHDDENYSLYQILLED